MSRDLFSARATQAHWKPDGCADCGVVHPCWSLTGPRGPWRCHDCHTQAKGSPKNA